MTYSHLMRMSWKSLHGADDWWDNDLWMNRRRFQHVSSATLTVPIDVVRVHQWKEDCWEQCWSFLMAVAQHICMWWAYHNRWRHVYYIHFGTGWLISVFCSGIKHHILLVIQHERWFQVKLDEANEWRRKSLQFLGKKDQCHHSTCLKCEGLGGGCSATEFHLVVILEVTFDPPPSKTIIPKSISVVDILTWVGGTTISWRSQSCLQRLFLARRRRRWNTVVQ